MLEAHRLVDIEYLPGIRAYAPGQHVFKTEYDIGMKAVHPFPSGEKLKDKPRLRGSLHVIAYCHPDILFRYALKYP